MNRLLGQWVWVVLLGAHVHAALASELVPADCRDGVDPESVICGTLRVPENYDQPRGRQIDLFVVVVPALEPREGAVPQFDLAGGPGLAVTESAFFYLDESLSTARLRRDRAVVLVDQRGTGRSNALRCPKLEQRHPLEPMYPLDEVRACRDDLAAANDLRRYGTVEAARDLDQVRQALGYDQIDLWGISYGTILAQVYLKMFPQRVSRAVLVGASPLDSRIPLYHALNAQRALDLLFFECQSDRKCRDAYPDLRADWQLVLKRLDQGPVDAVHVDEEGEERWAGVLTRETFGEALRNLLYTTSGQLRVPRIIHRASLGDFDPFLEAVSLPESPIPEGLYLAVTCAEATTRIPAGDVATATAGTFLGRYRVDAQRAACAEWPQGQLADDFFEQLHSDTPVLFLAGVMDVVTPPGWSDSVARAMPNSRVIRLPPGGHVLWDFGQAGDPGTCADDLAAQFYAQGSAKELDTSCIRRLQRPSW